MFYKKLNGHLGNTSSHVRQFAAIQGNTTTADPHLYAAQPGDRSLNHVGWRSRPVPSLFTPSGIDSFGFPTVDEDMPNK